MSNTSEEAATQPQKSRKVSPKLILALVILAASLIFIFSNLAEGTLYFLLMRFTMPIWVWFLVLLLCGVVIGSLFPWLRPRKKPDAETKD